VDEREGEGEGEGEGQRKPAVPRIPGGRLTASAAGLHPGLVDPRLVFTGLSASSVAEALGEIAQRLAKAHVVSDGGDLTRRLLERERLGCTGLGRGMAIPHCKLKDLGDIVLAVASFHPGVDFGAPDGIPVTLVFLILSPARSPGLHLQALARISRLLKSPGVAESLKNAHTPDEIVSALGTGGEEGSDTEIEDRKVGSSEPEPEPDSPEGGKE